MNKSIPELQIELNDLKRKGNLDKEIYLWFYEQNNPYEFNTNIISELTMPKQKSFALILTRNFSGARLTDVLLTRYRDAMPTPEFKREYGLAYANFIKDFLEYKNIAIISELIYPYTSPYFTNDNKIQEFYGEYLLA